MKRQTLVLKAPKSFIDRVLWPEFQQINVALSEYFSDVTDKVIRDQVFGQAGEVAKPQKLRGLGALRSRRSRPDRRGAV
jgi:hypothetical protein